MESNDSWAGGIILSIKILVLSLESKERMGRMSIIGRGTGLCLNPLPPPLARLLFPPMYPSAMHV
jgi:hypothetical protein